MGKKDFFFFEKKIITDSGLFFFVFLSFYYSIQLKMHTSIRTPTSSSTSASTAHLSTATTTGRTCSVWSPTSIGHGRVTPTAVIVSATVGTSVIVVPIIFVTITGLLSKERFSSWSSLFEINFVLANGFFSFLDEVFHGLFALEGDKPETFPLIFRFVERHFEF